MRRGRWHNQRQQHTGQPCGCHQRRGSQGGGTAIGEGHCRRGSSLAALPPDVAAAADPVAGWPSSKWETSKEKVGPWALRFRSKRRTTCRQGARCKGNPLRRWGPFLPPQPPLFSVPVVPEPHQYQRMPESPSFVDWCSPRVRCWDRWCLTLAHIPCPGSCRVNL